MLEDLARLGARTLLSEGAALGKAMPPSAKPGKRRPCPRALSMPRAATKGTDDCGSPAPRGSDELGGQVVRLRLELAAMTSRCERQALDISHLRRQLADAQDQPAPPPPRQAQADGATQTAEVACAAPRPGTDGNLHQGLETQRRQLDALQQEAGEKGRELGRARASQRLLQAELEEQRMIADQYREQVEVLEEQLRRAMTQRQEMAMSSGPRSRPSSASSRGLCDRAPIGAGSRPGSSRAVKAWVEPRGTPRGTPLASGRDGGRGAAGPELAGISSGSACEVDVDGEEASVKADADGDSDAEFRARRDRESHSVRETWAR
ncbi:unnamed protein product [Prorocentrum cordatum]|uniref:Centrosomal protein POC5 n=1 Tax=Prorocentrum cordatum TaxID=2364126 RepID=A0ABN9VW43_9DINO|nr:unnamed protein product [Polarella glacialis]